MSLISRRDAGKLLLAGCAGALMPARKLLGGTKIDSVVRGVQIGAQGWSFRDRSIDACIAAFVDAGLSECELSQVHFGGPPPGDPNLDPARLDLPLSNFQDLRKKFDDAGVSLSAYGNSFHTDITDAVLERSFQITEAMGLDCI